MRLFFLLGKDSNKLYNNTTSQNIIKLRIRSQWRFITG